MKPVSLPRQREAGLPPRWCSKNARKTFFSGVGDAGEPQIPPKRTKSPLRGRILPPAPRSRGSVSLGRGSGERQHQPSAAIEGPPSSPPPVPPHRFPPPRRDAPGAGGQPAAPASPRPGPAGAVLAAARPGAAPARRMRRRRRRWGRPDGRCGAAAGPGAAFKPRGRVASAVDVGEAPPAGWGGEGEGGTTTTRRGEEGGGVRAAPAAGRDPGAERRDGGGGGGWRRRRGGGE